MSTLDRRAADALVRSASQQRVALQVGHGEPAPPPDSAPREVFGVSATAAVYRRTALEAVALDGALPAA